MPTDVSNSNNGVTEQHRAISVAMTFMCKTCINK